MTGTQDNTHVTIKMSSGGWILGGAGIASTQTGGGIVTFTLNAGDVAVVNTGGEQPPDAGLPSLFGDGGLGGILDGSITCFNPYYPTFSELSGSLVQADNPIEVIVGNPCTLLPADKTACDHLESTMIPAETLGKHYVVAPPTGPKGDTPGYMVRIVGNVDDTHLTYLPSRPANCPEVINAGQLVDCAPPEPWPTGNACTGGANPLQGYFAEAFEVTGDHEFAMATFMLGAEIVDPGPDPTRPLMELEGRPVDEHALPRRAVPQELRLPRAR